LKRLDPAKSIQGDPSLFLCRVWPGLGWIWPGLAKFFVGSERRSSSGRARHCEERSDEAIRPRLWIASLRSQ
jgi:hypothetical protein